MQSCESCEADKMLPIEFEPESEAALLQSIEEADRGQLVPAEEVFHKLDEQR